MLDRARRIFYKNNLIEDLAQYNLNIPKKILSDKFPHRVINIEKLRNDRLNNPSPPEIELAKYIPNAIKEAPFLIINRSSWINLCDQNGIIDEKEKNRNLHQVDFLIPEASLVIETDSKKYHDHKRLEDLVRDQYLYLSHGIRVLRYDSFDFLNHLDEINRYMNVYNPMMNLSYEKLSDLYFDYIFANQIRSFETLFAYTKDFHQYDLSGILLTQKDLTILGWSIEKLNKLKEWLSYFLAKDIQFINIGKLSGNELVNQYKKRPKYDQTNNILQQLGYL